MQALVLKSYVRENLNQEKVKAIGNVLKRTDLKKYIQELKNAESKRNVIVILPFKNAFTTPPFAKLFPNKKVVYRIDTTLLAGVKIIDDDTVYDFGLISQLENIVSYIKESYD